MSTFEIYLGKSWACPCDPPESYDCWEFAKLLRKSEFYRSTPDPVPAADRLPETVAVLNAMPGWVNLMEPHPGCMVLFGDPVQHCGVYLGQALVAHCASTDCRTGTSRFDNLILMARLFNCVSFWELAHA